MDKKTRVQRKQEKQSGERKTQKRELHKDKKSDVNIQKKIYIGRKSENNLNGQLRMHSERVQPKLVTFMKEKN